LSGDGTSCFARGLHVAPNPWRKMRHVTHAGTALATGGCHGSARTAAGRGATAEQRPRDGAERRR
jgi:hypothetical protein